jgi:hypothetical protein
MLGVPEVAAAIRGPVGSGVVEIDVSDVESQVVG